MRGYRVQLIRLLRSLKDRFGEELRAAEVGVLRGETSATLLHFFPKLHLYLVDWWQPPPPDSPYARSRDSAARLSMREQRQNYQIAMQNVSPYKDRVTVLRGHSVRMADQVEDNFLHLVFIDADHTEEAVLADIEAWWPKVMPGGILSGHDYGTQDRAAASRSEVGKGAGLVGGKVDRVVGFPFDSCYTGGRACKRRISLCRWPVPPKC